MIVVRNPRFFWSGVIYVGVGAAALAVAFQYPMGTTMRMGPGYFPALLSALLLLVGAACMGKSLFVEGESISAFAFKPLILVLLACAAFGLLLESFGVVLALAALMLLAASASSKFGFDRITALGLCGFIAFCVGVFVLGLGVPLPLFGSQIEPIVAAIIRG
ncbi:tripartite tricarboxylate transporter TctB family protein [Agrobacterium tumefaciens]|uniref:tripartite tricarboxylate transporter TctB family protein n=1 Tax=Agrobacterium tumefaciens TaxID=358 RepID=UPI0012BA05D9|nr:tripartite tricarboxylate transporter TctB family protein [Agrobacterium tumefaciens]MQB07244.1 tripartite tricarboxylate transporter TctB family protein [Agrobacterium tumefaciens]